MINLFLTLIGSAIIIPVDSIYLKFNKDFYSNIIDSNEQLNITYAVLTWILIVLSIQLIILSQSNLDSTKVFVNGVLLGLAMYGVYNFTSAALYPSKWNNKIIIGDTLWGMTIVGSMSYILYQIQKEYNLY